MRKHSGMRPQDIAILLKIIAKGKASWHKKDLAKELFISASEVSESLHRSLVAGLISTDQKRVHKLSLLEFIQFGIKYVFPVVPGAVLNGLPTAHSHPEMKVVFNSDSPYVWPDIKGNIRGQAIEPLYDNAIPAALLDEKLYMMLALIDVFRVGKAREIKVATEKLKEYFNESSYQHNTN